MSVLALAKAQFKYDAAIKAMKIAHRLPMGEAKAKHLKRIIINKNILRGEMIAARNVVESKRDNKRLARAMDSAVSDLIFGTGS